MGWIGWIVWVVLAATAAGAGDLASLKADLTGPDGNARRKAAEALGEMGGAEAVDLLAAAYRAEAEDAFGVKAACAVALGRTGRPEAAGPLAEMLGDRDYWVRRKAVEALESIPGPEAERALARAVGDDDPRVRAAALEALGRRGGATDLLRAGLDDDDPRVRAAALSALVQAGVPDSDRLLAEALGEESWRVRLRAAALLAARGDARGREVLAGAVRQGRHAGTAVREWSCLGAEAVPDLAALWADPEVAPPEKGRILEVLERLDCRASTRFFLSLATDPGAAAGDRVRAVMVLFDRRGRLGAGDVRAVAGLLDEPDPNLKAVALQILLDRGGPEFLAQIAPLAEHPNPVVRHFALQNLAAHGGPEHEAVFVRALQDPKATNVRLAMETLGRIGSPAAIRALEPFLGQRKYRRYAQAAIDAIRERSP
ncbi:HEAT repeat domain-containing protein [Deferrisoma camini]|uniref:HEAT repeat domain-containing protein n=1 Tax=Deferrisoma camini TaxID=1035120 RepID=UPI00046D79A7|nr:HEAT repeat domain-containing protein [Deferrisoma camini]